MTPPKPRLLRLAVPAALLSLAACGSIPDPYPPLEQARTNLTRAEADQSAREAAPIAFRDANASLAAADEALSEGDKALLDHQVYMTDRRTAIAAAQVERRRIQAEAQTAGKDRQIEQLSQQLAGYRSRQTDEGTVLTLGTDVLFAVDQAELQPGARQRLQDLVQYLRQNPGQDVVVRGYTDATGGTEYNEGLSERRAGSVRDYLVSEGVASERVSAVGLGEEYPVASNATPQGRLQNRRVEIVLKNPPPAA